MKKNIIFAITLLLISIVLIIFSNNQKYIEGKIIDIYDNKNILVLINDEPFSISFKNRFNNIKLNDIVKIKTDGIVRESYPAQMTGLSIKTIRNDYKKLNTEIRSIVFNTSYYDEFLAYKSKFKTTIFKTKNELTEYSKKSNIKLPEDIDNLYKNNFAVLSNTSMTSSGTISFEGLYEYDNNLSINLTINTSEITTTDLITRGSIIFIDKKYIDYNINTTSQTIIKDE